MSDLQLSLVVLAVLVVAGVLAFNWLQMRSFRKRAAQAFEAPPRDILMEDLPPRAEAAADAAPGDAEPEAAPVAVPSFYETNPDDRAAPQAPPQDMPPAPVPAAPAVAAPNVDLDAVFERVEPFDQSFIDRLVQTIESMPRPIRLAGFDERSGQWVPIDDTSNGRFRRIQAALQLADRQAIATREELEEFAGAMHTLAHDLVLSLEMPTLAEAQQRAQAVDALCADVDIAIGLSVVARTGQVFQGTTIRALAESAGLELKPDGQFHFEDLQGQPQFTLDNQDPEPFFSDTIKSLTTSGITFLLDVPRASGGLAAFDRMVQMTKKFSATLDGIIVDDNRQPLNDNGLDAIRRHLSRVYATMDAAGVPAGSPLALRLFA